MANHVFEEAIKRTRKPDSRESWVFNVTIAPQDKNLLKSFMIQELSFYNGLVQGMASRLRAFPSTLLEITGAWEEFFSDCAMLGINARRLTTPGSLPDGLKRYTPLLFDDNGKPRQISERTLMLLELAANGGNIHPQARKAMVQEMIRFYRQQAQVSIASVPSQLREEQAYRTSFEMLEPLDYNRKRHVQLPRSAILAKFDAKTNATEFFIPYAKTGIKVQGDYSAPTWNLFILRQTGDTLDSPWQLELRKSPYSYLVKAIDFSPRRKGRGA